MSRRSLLANINGVANGGSSGGSSANTPSEPAGVGILYQYPSLANGANGLAEHLPPLKSTTGNSGSNNKLLSGINGSTSTYNGHYNNTTNGITGQYQTNGIVIDLDTMNTSVTGTNGVSNGHSGIVTSANSVLHLNGMQSLPLVRHTTSNLNMNGSSDTTATANNLANGTAGASMDSPIHHQQQNNVQSVVNTAATATNNNVNADANGSLKPKTMVATPEQVMKLYMNKLTPYEHHEIFSYPQIYFIGANAKKRPGIIGASNNCGYDDEQGSYTHIPHDHLSYRYEVLKVIGKGSFGQVVKAYDHKCHQVKLSSQQ